MSTILLFEGQAGRNPDTHGPPARNGRPRSLRELLADVTTGEHSRREFAPEARVRVVLVFEEDDQHAAFLKQPAWTKLW